MIDQTKTDPKLTKDGPPPKPTEDNTTGTGTINVRLDEPEMGLLPQGLFVMCIPLNSPKVTNIKAYGYAVAALFKLNALFTQVETARTQAQRGDLGMLKKLGNGVSGLFKP